MPTYDYECRSCGHSTEIIQSFKDKSLKKCPECGANDFHQLISGGAGLVFKGSGFYVTDNKAKKSESASVKKSDSSSEKPAEKTSSEKNSNKSDSSKSKSKKMEGIS